MPAPRVDLNISDRGQVARFTLPGGTLTTDAAAELAAAAASIEEDRTVRVVVLGAEGDVFCSGPHPDLDVLACRPDPASALARLRPPIISAVQGPCWSEGLEILLSTDVRIGDVDSSYALRHAVEGRVPAWGGTQRLPRAVRPGEAMAMALTGDAVSAERAKSLGLIHDVTDRLDERVAELVATLCERGPLALELMKEAIHRGSELPLRDGLRLEGDLNHQLAASDDRAEGLQAFFDKRPPDFSGR